jgi:hypothetical protein
MTVEFIYTLRLTDDCYYVGRTTDPNRTLAQHRSDGRMTRAWTSLHVPLVGKEAFVELEVMRDNRHEDDKTLEYMEKYGIDKVRGGAFCQIQLPPEQRSTIESMLRGGNNQCYECGNTNHYVNDCPYNQRNTRSLFCTRCGREGHFFGSCYAKKHVQGYYL